MCLKKNHDYAQRVKIVIEIAIVIEFATGAYIRLRLRIL
jgi:hypothetical protein